MIFCLGSLLQFITVFSFFYEACCCKLNFLWLKIFYSKRGDKIITKSFHYPPISQIRRHVLMLNAVSEVHFITSNILWMKSVFLTRSKGFSIYDILHFNVRLVSFILKCFITLTTWKLRGMIQFCNNLISE